MIYIITQAQILRFSKNIVSETINDHANFFLINNLSNLIKIRKFEQKTKISLKNICGK